jgi:hypothetical protein
MECCGEERETPFCPACGRKLRSPHPLDSLLAHCLRQWTTLSKSAATVRRKSDSPRWRDHRERRERSAAKTDKRAERWRDWADALAAILEQADEARPSA